MAEIKVKLNGRSIKIDKGATLARVLSENDAYHRDGTIIALGHDGKGPWKEKPKFMISTNKGDVVFESNLIGRKNDILGRIVGSDPHIVNVGPKTVSIGPFPSSSFGQYQEYELSDGDLVVDCAGRESDSACLVMCKSRHRSFYSLASPSSIGRIISGKDALVRLTPDDQILAISKLPPTVHARMSSLHGVTDLSTKIQKEGTWIQTCVSARMDTATPQSGELFLRGAKAGFMICRAETSTFLMSNGSRDFLITESNCLERKKGTITVRNVGKDSGQFYFYKRNRQSSGSHTVIGEFTQGMELLELAKPGDRISLVTEPQLIDCVGMMQIEAHRCLSALDLKQSRKGDVNDGAIVVEQTPSSALQMKQEHIVETVGLGKEDLVQVQLFEEQAPSSVRFFRAVTGLTFGRVGKLWISLNYSKLAGSIFVEGDTSRVDRPNLDPENVPVGPVLPGYIGLTNSVVTRVGTIGLRVDESEEFGPTCENLESTNMIGKIVGSSLEWLKKATKGYIIYIEEVSEHHGHVSDQINS